MKPENGYFVTQGLTVGYDGVPLIRDMDISLRRGEILTLIGPNGSGKSTILKSITRHLAAISGTVYLDGREIHSLSGKELATRLSVVLTDRIRPELMTCGELVSTARYPYTDGFGRLTQRDRAVVRRSLERVHAADLEEKLFVQLSDGQRQRIMLARAICQEPEIIVLDEPTSFLDIRHKIELLSILGQMAREEGITVVMSLHEIDLASKVSDRILCVKGEHIAALGAPEEIFSGPAIKELYGLDKGSFDCLFGSVELEKPAGVPRVFAVGGNGCGIPFYRALQKLGVPFAAGILFGNDLDCPVADALAHTVFKAEPFQPVAEELIQRAENVLESCGLVLDCGCPVGAFNGMNRRLLERAKELERPVLGTLAQLEEKLGGKAHD